MCKCVPADPKRQYSIRNTCKCVPADPKLQYSIKHMCKLCDGQENLCFRVGRQCVLYKNINILLKNNKLKLLKKYIFQLNNKFCKITGNYLYLLFYLF